MGSYIFIRDRVDGAVADRAPGPPGSEAAVAVGSRPATGTFDEVVLPRERR
ncbi:hypothetical protein QVL82_00715 [Cellulosimicrobium funkei]|uniref:hypothetical protein n=1 Tax=Cellulosimicrobium funkei TaxID=264251 RepID=UPI0037576931